MFKVNNKDTRTTPLVSWCWLGGLPPVIAEIVSLPCYIGYVVASNNCSKSSLVKTHRILQNLFLNKISKNRYLQTLEKFLFIQKLCLMWVSLPNCCFFFSVGLHKSFFSRDARLSARILEFENARSKQVQRNIV